MEIYIHICILEIYTYIRLCVYKRKFIISYPLFILPKILSKDENKQD